MITSFGQRITTLSIGKSSSHYRRCKPGSLVTGSNKRSHQQIKSTTTMVVRTHGNHASVFHPGEVQVQERVGVREHVVESEMEQYIRPYMPAQHQNFFENQPILYLSSLDSMGRVWSSCVVGKPGFLSCPTDEQLIISPLHLNPHDPLSNNLSVGASLGGLGLEMHTRRRNRLNTRVTGMQLPTAGGAPGNLKLSVDLSFGNCPKYIQSRVLQLDYNRLTHAHQAPVAGGHDASPQAGGVIKGGSSLGPEQTAIITASDTFFLGTCFTGPTPAGVSDAVIGCDMSHRGGPPGFVQVEKAEGGGVVLRWADYRGNNMFQSFGNLFTNPSAGLLFIDYNTGDTLQLTGTASVDYEDVSLPGAQRTVKFTVDEWIHVAKALPLKPSGPVQYSPFNPESTRPASTTQPTTTISQPSGPPLVQLVGVKQDASDVKTFVFTLPKGGGVGKGETWTYRGGQYSTFELTAAQAKQAGVESSGGTKVDRTWTISSHPDWSKETGCFTITVRRAGRVSSWLHDQLKPGDKLTVRSFGGDFTALNVLDHVDDDDHGLTESTPVEGVLLLAGGIGITPMRSIMQDLLNASKSGQTRAPKQVVLAYWVHQHSHAALAEELHQLAVQQLGGADDASGTTISDVNGVTVKLALYATRNPGPAAVTAAAIGGAAAAVAGGGAGAAAATCAAAAVASGKVLGPLWEKSEGRVTEEVVSKVVGGSLSGWHVFSCGPPGFMTSVDKAVAGLGLGPTHLHTESFSF